MEARCCCQLCCEASKEARRSGDIWIELIRKRARFSEYLISRLACIGLVDGEPRTTTNHLYITIPQNCLVYLGSPCTSESFSKQAVGTDGIAARRLPNGVRDVDMF
jgi:hypothetical protein